MKEAMRGNVKSSKSVSLLGCSPLYLRKWIESQFTQGMTWDNIHVDHMMPCASFNLIDSDEQTRCFHYTNLQPLLAEDNLKKSDSIVHDMKWCSGEWLIRPKGSTLYRPRLCKVRVTNQR